MGVGTRSEEERWAHNRHDEGFIARTAKWNAAGTASWSASARQTLIGLDVANRIFSKQLSEGQRVNVESPELVQAVLQVVEH